MIFILNSWSGIFNRGLFGKKIIFLIIIFPCSTPINFFTGTEYSGLCPAFLHGTLVFSWVAVSQQALPSSLLPCGGLVVQLCLQSYSSGLLVSTETEFNWSEIIFYK